MSWFADRRALRQFEMLAEGLPLPKRPEPGPTKLAARLAAAGGAGREWADGQPGAKPKFYPSGPPVRLSRHGVAIRTRPKAKGGKLGPIGRRG